MLAVRGENEIIPHSKCGLSFPLGDAFSFGPQIGHRRISDADKLATGGDTLTGPPPPTPPPRETSQVVDCVIAKSGSRVGEDERSTPKCQSLGDHHYYGHSLLEFPTLSYT